MNADSHEPIWTSGGVAPAACSMMLAASLSYPGVHQETYENVETFATPAAWRSGRTVEISESYVCAGRARTLESLKGLLGRYCSANWNGYDEASLSEKSWNACYAFVQDLPQWIAGAEALVDADGEVSIEWYKSKDRYLELSFADSGVTHCYFRTPERKCSCIFAKPNDPMILDFISQISNVG